jgi:hypothetical protein
VHVADVDGLRVTDTVLREIAGDALDLEYTEADVRRARLINIGDDGLDLMGSRVTLSDSMILGARGNGISSGEESVVKVLSTLVAQSSVGVLAKNAAKISLSGSVLYANESGLRTYQRTVRYAGNSEVTADVLCVAESKKKPVDRGDRDSDRLDRGRVLLDLPQPGVLDHVLEDVLELSSWQELSGWISDQRREVVR